jgi:hypothetical protein
MFRPSTLHGVCALLSCVTTGTIWILHCCVVRYSSLQGVAVNSAVAPIVSRDCGCMDELAIIEPIVQTNLMRKTKGEYR